MANSKKRINFVCDEFYFQMIVTMKKALFAFMALALLVACDPEELNNLLNPTVPATSISINNPPKSMTVGETITLTVTVQPSNATDKVEWTSYIEDVLSVKDGVVTALKEGIGSIGVSAGDVADGCRIIVNPANGGKTEVTSITLNKQKLELEISKTEQLIATVLPDNATDKTLNWSSVDDGIATVSSDGTITAVAAGTVTVTATSLSNTNVKADCEVTVLAPKAPRYYFQTSDNLGQAKLYVDGTQFGSSITVNYATNDGTDIWYYTSDGFYKENQKIYNVNRESLGDGQYHIFHGLAVKNGLLHYVYSTHTDSDYRMYFRSVDLSTHKVFESKLNETSYAQFYTASANGNSMCVGKDGKVYVMGSIRPLSYWTAKIWEITPATETSAAVITEHVMFEGSSSLLPATYDIAAGPDGSVYALIQYEDKSASKSEMVLFKDFQEVRRYENYNYGYLSIDGTDVYLFLTRTDNSTCEIYKNADVIKGPFTNVFKRNGCVAADGIGGYYYGYTKVENSDLSGYLYDSTGKLLLHPKAMIIRLHVAK